MSESDRHQVTRLLGKLQESPAALEQLAGIVYADIHRLAHHQRQGFRGGETLRTTVLAHEAFLKVFRQDDAIINDRAHLMRIMALAMRQIIVDHARRQFADKRGGEAPHVELNEQAVADASRDAELVLDIDAAIDRLAEVDQELADLITARFYVGLSSDEIAEMKGRSPRTIQRQLKRASTWLRYELLESAG